MAAQERSPDASSAFPYDRPTDIDRAVDTTDRVRSSTDGTMPHESPISDESIAQHKFGPTVNEGYRSDSGISNEPSSQAYGGFWRSKALQFKFGRRIVSALEGRDPDQPRDSHQIGARSRPWRTTLIRFGPLSGIFCMFVAAASIVASLGILAGSNGKATPSWSVPPSTYLAIFTALANLSMRYAAIQGVVIAWWYRARKGSTVSKLHWDWHAGTTLRGALTAGRHMGMLGLACIFSTVVVIDGPLLQRSTSVRSAPTSNNPLTLNAMMSPEIPHLSSGAWYRDGTYRWSNAFNDTMPTPNGETSNHVWPEYDLKIMSYVSKGWLQDLPFHDLVQGCTGTCQVKMKAPAMFATTCASHQRESNFHNIVTSEKVLEQAVAPPLEADALISSVQLVLEDDKETVNLITGIWAGEDCAGLLNYTICTLEAGIGEYTFTVQRDGSAVLDEDSALQPDFVAFANNTAVNHDFSKKTRDYTSTLGGIVAMVAHRFNAFVFYYGGGKNPLGNLAGYLPVEQYLKRDTIGSTCPSYERDPRDDIIRAMNNLMIRMGAHTATRPLADFKDKIDPGVVVNSTVTGQLISPHNVFHTDYSYFIGAAVVELVCIALVMPTYWGWWKFGRPVSFSPLETAKAFEAPLLAECDSNSSARGLAYAMAKTDVQYGAMVSDSKTGGFKLAFADPDSISPPQRGSRYQNH